MVDLAPPAGAIAVGDTIELEAVAADCALGGHFGYVYVDAFGTQLPGLSVVKTGPAEVEQGDMMTYDLVYRNHGDAEADDVVVVETLPEQTSFVSVSDPRCVHAGGIVTCTLGALPVDQIGTVHITVAVSRKATGTITNGNYSIQGKGVGKIFGPPVVTTVTPRTCMDLVTEKRLCAAEGDFTVTFQVRNRSLKSLHHLFLMPDGDAYTVTPDYFNFAIQPAPAIPYPRPIPPGALSGPLTVTVHGAAPGPVKLGLIGLDELLDGCCTVEKVVELPACDCAQIPQISPACLSFPSNPASFDLDFTLQNLTSHKISQILIAPHKPPTLDIQKNRFEVDLDRAQSAELPIHVSGPGAASNPVCFLVSLRSDACEKCCSIEQCVTPGFCNFLPHKALGAAQIFLSPLQVVIGNLGSTGQDGVEIDLGKMDGFTAVWSDPAAVEAPAEGARLLVGATGSVDGQGGWSLGILQVEDTGEERAVTADFGAFGYRVEVYRAGVLVRAVHGDGGPVGTTGAWPSRGGALRLPNGEVALVLGIDSGFWRFEDGQEVKGDELRVIPDVEGKVDFLTAFSLRAAKIPTLVIVDEILGGSGPDAALGLFFGASLRE